MNADHFTSTSGGTLCCIGTRKEDRDDHSREI